VRNIFRRGTAVPAEVSARAGLGRGDAVLAAAVADDGTWLLGSRDALVIVKEDGVLRLPWECVETVDWDRDESRLRVTEVGEFGQLRPVHTVHVPHPGLLLPMVRERVTASVLLQRRVPVSDRLGLLVVARRPPRGRGDITWAVELDAGLDPDDPVVARAAADALRAAQDELGPGQPTI
jgi:hypothetical protein